MLDINAVTPSEWRHQSEKAATHAGSWSLEFIDDTNRITRNYTTLSTLGSLDGHILQIMLLSHTQIEPGEAEIHDIALIDNDKALVSLMVGNVCYLIQLHAPGVTQEDLDQVRVVHFAELLMDDISHVHKLFSAMVVNLLPPESLRNLEEMHEHVSEILQLPFVSYVAAVVKSSQDIEKLFLNQPVSLNGIAATLVRIAIR